MEVAALRVVSVTKRYGATLAVSGASLTLEHGKIHALVGENGAGKSTLSSIAAGLVVPDEGHVEIAGERLSPHNARTAVARGVGMVQQHFRLIEALTVLENAMLGAEPVRGGRIDMGAARAKLQTVLDELRTKLDPRARVESLGVGDRQRLEIARILFHDARVVLLDEPTPMEGAPSLSSHTSSTRCSTTPTPRPSCAAGGSSRRVRSSVCVKASTARCNVARSSTTRSTTPRR